MCRVQSKDIEASLRSANTVLKRQVLSDGTCQLGNFFTFLTFSTFAQMCVKNHVKQKLKLCFRKISCTLFCVHGPE